jgi:RNA ligase (TIGR02306 family)
MSTHTVPVVYIEAVEKHPNADRLDICQIKGWQCVTGRGSFQSGDLAIYIPIDSVLGGEVESYLFPPDSKVTLSKSRVKTIKLRGAISQGMVVKPDAELQRKFGLDGVLEGMDLAAALGISKYEPPAADYTPKPGRNHMGRPTFNNPLFHKYTDIEHYHNHMSAIPEDSDVYISEKLHGTSARYGVLPAVPSNWFDRVRQFFGLLPKFQFCYGSRNVQLQGRLVKKTFYSGDVYGRVAKEYRLEMKLHPGEVLYGEIVGEGIQKDYDYGYRNGHYGFFAYDVKVDGTYLDPDAFIEFCRDRNIPQVPFIHRGPFNSDYVSTQVGGPSEIQDLDLGPGGGGFKSTQPIREGIVIKPAKDRMAYFGRCVLKWVNPEYLLSDPTENH